MGKTCEPKALSVQSMTKFTTKKKKKDTGEREIHTQLNAEFQRITRRDKKAFFSEHCKQIEKNNRMGKTRDCFKKIGDIKGTFHAKMS